MAQTGTTFTLQSSSYQGRYLKLTCTSSQDIANNKTNISWTLESIGGSSGHYATIVRVNINGSEVYSIDKGYTYDAFPVTKGSTTGSISVPMGSDGNKSITIYMDAAIYTSSTTRYSDTWTLNTVPRYPTISSFSVAKVSGSSTSVSVTWAGSAPGGSINKVEYSKDNGSTWTNANTTSSPFTISGLTSNTGYNFKIRVTSSASGLTATSSAYYQSTYQQPTANISTANISGYSGLSQIKVSWSSNMDIAKVEYSRDNGSTWYNAGDPNASSGNYTYTGLSENTSYNFKVRVTATTGSCVTTSGTSSLTTRKRVSGNLYINGTKVGTSNGQTGIALKNGDTLEIKDITNNAGCGYKLFFENPDNQNQYLSAKTTGTTAISMTAEQIRQRLQYMTSVNSQGYNVGIVTLDGSDNKALYYEFFGTLSVVNSNPTFTTSNWTYQDTNANTVALTGSNQILVNGFSKLRVNIGTAATGVNYATISQYTVSGCTSGSSTTTGNIDCATATNGGTITVAARDSRGNTTSTSRTATFKDYFVPTLTSITATRSNGGVGTQTSLTFNGTWWNANFGASANTLSASYRYKSGSTWSTARAISLTTSGNTYSFSTNQLYGDLAADGFTLGTTFTIEVTITDELNGGKAWTTTLNSGTPAIAISGSNIAVGSQYDTTKGGKIQINNGGLGAIHVTGNDIAIRLTHATSGKAIGFGIGAGGTNRGIWDFVQSKWAVYDDDNGNIVLNKNVSIPNYNFTAGNSNGQNTFAIHGGNNSNIYWKEYGYGDKFRIIPNFSGADDNNQLKVQGAVGDAGTDPSLYDLMYITGKSGNLWVKGNITSANYKTLTLEGGSGNTAGYRCIAATTASAWNNYRAVLLVKSRHGGAGLLSFSISFGTDTNTLSGTPSVTYDGGQTQFGGADSWVMRREGAKVELWWKYYDYNSTTITVIQSDFNIVSNGTWQTSLPSGGTIYYACNSAYPIGSIYMSINNTNPGSLFGGTWERLPTGRFLYNSAGSSWSSSSITGTTTDSQGSHHHGSSAMKADIGFNWTTQNELVEKVRGTFTGGNKRMNNMPSYSEGSYSGSAVAVEGNTDDAGSHGHNIPYIAVFMWRRTA